MSNTSKIITAISIFTMLFVGCKKEEIEMPALPVVLEPETSATYTLTFEGSWSLANHPTDYPTNAHFSPLIGLVHNDRTEVIRLDRQASAGIKAMAERGKTTPLDIELGNVIANGDGFSLIVADKGLGTGVGSWTGEISVNTTHHLLSVVSMLAPSPDWFVGISNLDLYDGTKFIDELIVDMVVYDAGTDSGVSFTSPDSVTSPVVNTFAVTDAPIGNGTEVSKPFARIVLKKK